MAAQIWVDIDSGNGLVPSGITWTNVDFSFVSFCGISTWEQFHDDVIKWKHFPRNWPFVRRIHRSPVNSPHKSQWRGALMFSFICAWIYGWVNTCVAGELRRQHAHYDVIVMSQSVPRPLYCVMSLKIILIKLLSYRPGTNELKMRSPCNFMQ